MAASDRRSPLAVFLTLALLAPLAQLLRTQQPWSCFQLTGDESFYLQAFVNWSRGLGYRITGDLQPFSPLISVGPPLAWGTAAIHSLTGADWPQAGRIFVHLCFYSLLLLLSAWVGRRARSWTAAVLMAGSFGFVVARSIAGPYLTYGVLGEIPGALAAWGALLLLERGRLRLAGLAVVFAFFVKGTYLFLIPSLCLAALLRFGRRGLWTAALAALGLAVWCLGIDYARGDSPGQYLVTFVTNAARVSGKAEFSQVLSFFGQAGFLNAAVTLLILPLGLPVPKLRRRLSLPEVSPAELGAWIFFGCGLAYYLVLHGRPQPKHWFVFYNVGAAALCAQLSRALAPRISAWIPEEHVKLSLIAVALTWLVNVPGIGRRNFLRAEAFGCPVKEQAFVQERLRGMLARNELQPGELTGVAEASSTLFLYGLGFNPPYLPGWKERGAGPGWITGDVATLEPLPAPCRYDWKGAYVALVRCPDAQRF